MTSDDIDSGFDPEVESAALRALEGETAEYFRWRLIFWAVRWAIGFGIIAVVVHFRPDWSWLWWFGAGAAAITPVSALVMGWPLKRRIRRTDRALTELETALGEAEAD